MAELHNDDSMIGWPEGPEPEATVDIGVLTRGKPTLGITLTSLLLQDYCRVRIHIVDISETPVINRDDVTLAMRLAFDRGVHCSYERLSERKKGFSLGRLRLLEMIAGPYVCFVEDDIALSSSVVARLLHAASRQQGFGCISPVSKNPALPFGGRRETPCYVPGSLLYLDDVLGGVLRMYYGSTVDVVDAVRAPDKVWEVAFLGELLRQLGRPPVLEPSAVIYHLDYHDMQNWQLADTSIVRRSIAVAHRLAARPVAESIAV
ncbi:MAG: glycosyltransferase family A protein [Chloroflexota bacterium]